MVQPEVVALPVEVDEGDRLCGFSLGPIGHCDVPVFETALQYLSERVVVAHLELKLRPLLIRLLEILRVAKAEGLAYQRGCRVTRESESDCDALAHAAAA